MTFHGDFWVATSAAAPVIALTIVVTLPDVTKNFNDAATWRDTIRWDLATASERRPAVSIWDRDTTPARQIGAIEPESGEHGNRPVDERELYWSKKLFPMTVANRVATHVNMLIQIVLLGISLCALAYEQDVAPMWLAIVLAVGGLLMLAWTIGNMGTFRRKWEMIPNEVSELRERRRQSYVSYYGSAKFYADIKEAVREIREREARERET